MTADPEKVMQMAMAMMEKVDAQLVRVYDKLDEIARERREEAREHGGRTRFFGTTFDLNTVNVSLNEDTLGGSFAFFGCTFIDGFVQ